MHAKNILISGASSGIGAATAVALAAQGHNVFAGFRNLDNSTESERFHPIQLDVTDPQSIDNALSKIQKILNDKTLDAVVCCAGTFAAGSLENTPLQTWRHSFEVNVFGSAALIQAALPSLRQSKGRIVLISSVGGYLAAPYVSSYIASKYAVEGLGDSLRLELAAFDIKLAIVQPGAIATRMMSSTASDVRCAQKLETNNTYQKIGSAVAKFYDNAPKRALDVQLVVDAIDHAICASHPKTRYSIGLEAKALRFFQAIIPDKIFDKLKLKSMNIT